MSGLFPYFPAFLDLIGRAVVVLGGDDELAVLARRLLESGAGVSVFTSAPGAEMAALAGAVRLQRRRWRAADFRGAALVIAGADEARPQRARIAAKGAQAVFCQIGSAQASDIALGAAFVRGPMAIGMNAQGMAPELEAAMRARIEAALPAGFSAFFAAAIAARPAVEAKLADQAARAQFWAHLARAAAEASPADWRAWIEAELASA